MGLILHPAPWDQAAGSADLSGGALTGIDSRAQGLEGVGVGRGDGAHGATGAGIGEGGAPRGRGLAGGDAAAYGLRGQGQGQVQGPVGERPSLGALCSVLSLQRQSRELALQLRTALRDAASEWRYLRCQGLRRLTSLLRDASEDTEVAALLRESQLYSQLQGTQDLPGTLQK